MNKLISHETIVTLPSGATITTLHLTPEGRARLSTNGTLIPCVAQPLPPARVVRRRWWRGITP